MTDVDIAYKIIEFEGGYVNDPSDPGGETKYGIAKRYHPKVDIKNLTKEEAAKIYINRYITRVSRVTHYRAKFFLADSLVAGHKICVQAMQLCLNALYKNQLAVDGVIGPKTIDAVNSVKESDIDDILLLIQSHARFFATVMANRVMRIQRLRGRPIKDYTNGWTNRIVKRCEVWT